MALYYWDEDDNLIYTPRDMSEAEKNEKQKMGDFRRHRIEEKATKPFTFLRLRPLPASPNNWYDNAKEEKFLNPTEKNGSYSLDPKYATQERFKESYFKLADRNYSVLSRNLKQLFIDVNDAFIKLKEIYEKQPDSITKQKNITNLNNQLQQIKDMLTYTTNFFNKYCNNDYSNLGHRTTKYINFNPNNCQVFGKMSQESQFLSKANHNFTQTETAIAVAKQLDKVLDLDFKNLNAIWKDDKQHNYTRFKNTLTKFVKAGLNPILQSQQNIGKN